MTDAVNKFAKHVLNHPPEVKEIWVDAFDEMTVHTRKIYPKKLIDNARPNEPEDIKKYRHKTHQYITHASINEAIIRQAKILQNSHYEYKSGISEELKEYIETKNLIEYDAKGTPDESDFEQVTYSRFFRFMFETGNGLIVLMPINSKNAQFPPSQNEANEPVKLGYSIVEPERIYFISDEAVLFKNKEEIEVAKDRAKVWQHTLTYVTVDGYWKLIPFYSKNQNGNWELNYRPELWYSMIANDSDPFDGLPVIITKGLATYDEKGNLYYESFYSGFVPWGNEAIIAYSEDKAVRILNNFPVREEKEEVCDTCKGSGKIIKDKDTHNCGVCRGSGVTTAKGPYATYRKKPPSINEDAEWSKIPALTFIAPPVQALEHSFKTWQYFLDKADQKVNIKYAIDESQSGVAKNIDRQGLIDMQVAVANNWFDNIIYKSLWAMESLLKPNKADRLEPKIKKPTADDLQFKTKSQMLGELKEMKESNAPNYLISLKIEEITNRMFPDDPLKQKFVKVLSFFDPLFGYSQEQIRTLQPTSAFKNDIIRHVLGESELRRLKVTEPDFFADADVEEIANALELAIQPKLSARDITIENLFNGTE